MSYQTALKIADVVQDIDRKKYVLPSIQREFVWSTTQIENLFDSLMQEYPIGSFLFWKIKQEEISKFQFYEFLRNYHEKDSRHNVLFNANGNGDITAILDGQQRLTSLYIGLKGSYASHMKYRKKDDPNSYPVRRLYLNLLQPGEDDLNLKYAFRFLTDDEVKKDNEKRDDNNQSVNFWFLVGEILNFEDTYELNDFLTDNGIFDISDREKKRWANQALYTLFKVIRDTETISYYQEKSADLDKILNIFIRVNSGGAQLSYSDLLLSFATAQWEQHSAREEISHLVDNLNEIGRGFQFNADMVLKTCLVLRDEKNIAFKVNNFNQKTMREIEKNWDLLKKAMQLAVETVASFGFSSKNLTSNNAIIPIAYYICSKGLPNNFARSGNFREDRNLIRKWLISSLLKHTFSSSIDNTLTSIREIIRKNTGSFPLQQIAEHFKGTNHNITFTSDDIQNLTSIQCNSGNALLVLSLLYPNADLRQDFHIDHIFPKSKFTKNYLKKQNIADASAEFYCKKVNYLGNLQLLDGTLNEEKSDMLFDEWLMKTYPDKAECKEYCQKHFIPDINLSFTNFEQFLIEREELLIERLTQILS